MQCYWLLDKFFQYPIEVKLEIEAAKELAFPSVTVCNLNPIRSQKLNRDEQFESLKHFTDQIQNDDMLYDFYYDNSDWLCELI